MKIIDAHVHFWDLANKINSWVLRQSNSCLHKNYLPDDLLKMCVNELMGVVHIEAHDSIIPTMIEVEWLNNKMKNYKIQYKHIAFVDITLPLYDFKKIIDQMAYHNNVVGIRHILSHSVKFNYNPNDNDLSSHENIANNLEYLASNNLIFDCQLYAHQISNILPAIVKSNIITVIDHMLLPAWDNHGDKDCQLWQDKIVEISQHKNIYMKLSLLGILQNKFDFAVRFCLENFAINRLVYGSNYPISYNNDYNIWANYLDSLDYTDKIKEQIFYKNAQKLFKFN